MFTTYTPLLLSFFLFFCGNLEVKKEKITSNTTTKHLKKHPNFNDYWYAGKAEITSYTLSQARYGDVYEGTAVTIFVTEDFLPKKQVKADYSDKNNIPVLKLNSTKNFTTGIYPYSIMTSTFTPINNNQNALKISLSSQEWCGNTFVQLNNRVNYQVQFFSYFETNSDRKITLKKLPLENDFWTKLRINPKSIKTGRYQVIPSMEFLALNHQKIKEYDAEVSLIEKGDFTYFSVFYPSLKRKLSIQVTSVFPYTIEGWEEVTINRGKTQNTKATKIKTIQSAYWAKNGVTDTKERKELGL